MPRDYKISLDDILEAVSRIEAYTAGMDLSQFQADLKTVDSVIRNLEIIGEATKNIPAAVRSASSDVPWSRIAGMRDILIHVYFNVDIEIVWDVLQNKLPGLKANVLKLLEKDGTGESPP